MIALLVQEPVQSAARGGLHLFGAYSLADPQFLLLVPLGALLLVLQRSKRARAAGRIPLLPASPRTSARQRWSFLTSWLQEAALMLAIVALARPLRANVELDVASEGVDIVLALDRSGSMRFDDLEPGKNRLQVAKEVVGDFAERRMTDREGASDNVALLPFARYPTLLCPFTLDVDALRGFLDQVELAERREVDGTGIGVALAKAVSILRTSDAKSKVCVLLTDGENNVHEIEPLAAAELAAEEGIKVYTIYAARYTYRQDVFRGVVRDPTPPDNRELRAIADTTGGRFYEARDREALAGIYAEIEELERTPRQERRFEETYDLYLWLLGPALACYAVAALSRATWARRLA
jgi:Ca-activated chloride channel family protein